MKVIKSDSLEFLKSIKDYDNDIIYCDPPYALGSEVIIRKDGKVDYKKANDFMSKWEMPTGDYWEKWFNEAYRTLKHGGWLIMFGMDRQLLLFKYYAHLAGFEEQQSLYWYFISNFPKATDLSKMIDKNAGAEREKVKVIGNQQRLVYGEYNGIQDDNNPITDLAKKYDGYKYSISPLKQTNETIMVFKKPTKTGSVLHDTLAYENGDTTITVGAIDIDGNRVETIEEIEQGRNGRNVKATFQQSELKEEKREYRNDGRYPAQTFIDSQVADALDKQSGVSKSSVGSFNSNDYEIKDTSVPFTRGDFEGYGDIGGCSKILHKCDYTKDDHDLYFYEPKVSSSERNAGLNGFDDKQKVGEYCLAYHNGEKRIDNAQTQKNTHPTLKPIALNERVLKLFKTPNDQKICYAFGGAGSEIIGGIKAGFDNWVACEINQEYVDIANARIYYWKETMTTQTDIFDFIER